MIPEREQRMGCTGSVPAPGTTWARPDAFIVAAAWLKHLAIPFVTKGRLASGLTIQDAIALRRERREW